MSRYLSSFLTLLLIALFLVGCGGETTQPTQQPTATSDAGTANLQAVKDYLVKQTTTLKTHSIGLKEAGNSYYTLAKDANFDYAALLQQKKSDVITVVQQARDAWMKASPSYEQMEGIVAGEASLNKYDVILDAGVDGATGGEDVAPIDLTLPDGKKLEKPGNLFGVSESTLWGTDTRFAIANVQVDYNNNGTQDFGDILPDPNVLKSVADAIDQQVDALLVDANAWQPTPGDIFSALTGNVPTVSDFFASWKTSRFVSDEGAASKDFAVISRLSDIVDNITSWQTMYSGVSPLAQKADATQDAQIIKGFEDLKTYVSDLQTQEQNGKRFTPADADLLSAEAQRRADAINGQITQMAAKLNIRIQ